METDQHMLDPDAVYLDYEGILWNLVMCDSRYVYLHTDSGVEMVLEHPEFNSRVHTGMLIQQHKIPDLVFLS